MSKLSKFAGFLRKLSAPQGELRAIAGIARTLTDVLAISPDERAKVQGYIDTLEGGADRISETIATLDKVVEYKPSAKELQAAVKSALPDVLGGLVEAEVRKRLAEVKPAAPAT